MVGVSSADIAPLPKRHTGILSFLKVLLRFSQGPGSCGITHRFLAKKSKLTAGLLNLKFSCQNFGGELVCFWLSGNFLVLYIHNAFLCHWTCCSYSMVGCYKGLLVYCFWDFERFDLDIRIRIQTCQICTSQRSQTGGGCCAHAACSG